MLFIAMVPQSGALVVKAGNLLLFIFLTNITAMQKQGCKYENIDMDTIHLIKTEIPSLASIDDDSDCFLGFDLIISNFTEKCRVCYNHLTINKDFPQQKVMREMHRKSIQFNNHSATKTVANEIINSLKKIKNPYSTLYLQRSSEGTISLTKDFIPLKSNIHLVLRFLFNKNLIHSHTFCADKIALKNIILEHLILELSNEMDLFLEEQNKSSSCTIS